MKIVEIIAGLNTATGPQTLRVEPNPTGLTVLILDVVKPEELAAAIRDTLAAPARAADIPFIRVRAKIGDLELDVADDATGAGRMLTETRGGGVPLILEAGTDIDTLLDRIAIAAGVEDPATLMLALTSTTRAEAATQASPNTASASANASASNASAEDASRTRATASPRAPDDALLRAYAESHARATKLARAVRAIDARMTASVVPDWLWIATGLGGAAVFMTVIALLYPELRVYIIPALLALSLLGFAAYALRAWRELKTRSVLLTERAELRARREAARAECRRLESQGVDPARALSSDLLPANLPQIIAESALPPEAPPPPTDRQLLVLARTSSPLAAQNPLLSRPFQKL